MNLAPMYRPKIGLVALMLMTACGPNGPDWDLRGGDTFNSRADAPAPPPADGNGITTYGDYQAVTAKRGETVNSIAARLSLNAEEVARFNAIGGDDPLREGEVLVLPKTVPQGLDVTAIASTALDRVETTALPAAAPAAPAAPEPARHKVQRGETAFGIARQYNVTAKSLADWNGLGPDMGVREGQMLIIPVAGAAPPAPAVIAPGTGSPTPVPPSAKDPLPAEKTTPPAAQTPPAADLSKDVTAASAAAFVMPTSGNIIRGYEKKKNDGIDIAAAAGAPVIAANAGTVAAITRDTKGTPIVVIRHSGGLLTVYAGVDALTVEKGATVARGQKIAVVRAGDPSFLHFEVRKGVDSVDPMDYLQ